MELFDAASSPGRRGQEFGRPSMKDLLQQVYSAHISVTEGLQKQVSSLTALVSEKEKELRNFSCQHCASIKDTFERYKASYQQMIEKLETKIKLLEEKNAAQEKELRGRNGSPIVNGTSPRLAKNGTSSEGRRQLLSGTASPKLWDSFLQEDSPRHTSCLVPPSPVTSEKSFEFKEIPVAGRSTVQTVPETLECELYGAVADDEATAYRPPLSAITKGEEDNGEDFIRLRGRAEPAEEVPSKHWPVDCTKEKKTNADQTDSESAELLIDGQEDRVTDAESEGSPSLLEPDRVANLASPCKTWDRDEVPPSNTASIVTPARLLSEVPRRQLVSAEDDGDKSPSLLDTFAVPRSIPLPTAKDAVKEADPLSPHASDVTVCDVTMRDDDPCPKSAQPGGGKLSLLRKRRASPTEPVDVSMAPPLSREKRKKQTKLSDRYFLSVNRTTVPATRSSSIFRRKELSQTHVDSHFTDDSLFSMPRKLIDPDETFVEPELLQDFKTPFSAKALCRPGPGTGGSATEVKQDLDNADKGSHVEEASSSSQA
ncbi:hypothetical protein HPB50_007455 [Hyalomma asiaticum]|uniref:Uncharacterized protein n=1 Tax=Hyalomma asiaticum TaxID=266040 RepID=A0ACB7SNM1_HYAAI|nr:hypothetical protein HPB50_007455 [Hyalomma asiaticum]